MYFTTQPGNTSGCPGGVPLPPPPRIDEVKKPQLEENEGKADPREGPAGGASRHEEAPRTRREPTTSSRGRGYPGGGRRGGNPRGGGTRLFDPVVEVEVTDMTIVRDL